MSNLLPFETIERETIIRKEFTTSEKFGCDPNNRPIKELLGYGIININKPKGPTSHQISAFVQQILNIDKSGHGGTLDPRVTGVLPVALGKATRIVNFLLPAGKEYICLLHLHDDYGEYQIRKAISEFVGVNEQLPPVKSAVKRQIRQRKIYYIKIHQIISRDVLFTVGCQAGTYIRRLCDDIGKKLGSGGHMAQLIRTKAGPFKLDESWTLQDLKDAYHYYKKGNEKFLRKIILPIESGIKHLAKIWVIDTSVDTLTHGADLGIPGISKVETGIKTGDKVAILTLKNELVGFGISRKSTEEMLGDKGIAVKTDKMFMPPGTYPRYSRAN